MPNVVGKSQAGALPACFVVKNGSKILSIVARDIPVPVSPTFTDVRANFRVGRHGDILPSTSTSPLRYSEPTVGHGVTGIDGKDSRST